MRNTSQGARLLAIVGAVSLAAAGLVSVFTDDTVDWAWGAMILTSLVGLAALSMAAVAALRQLGRDRS